MHHLFFALYPAPEAAARMVAFARELRRRRGLTGRAVPAERLHVSLNAVGTTPRLDAQVIARACAAAGQVGVPPFAVALDRVESWGRRDDSRTIVLRADDGVIGVEALHGALHARLCEAGLSPPREPPLVPHVTLLRDPVEVPQEFTETFRWTAAEYVLLAGRRDASGHTVLGRWPLGEKP